MEMYMGKIKKDAYKYNYKYKNKCTCKGNPISNSTEKNNFKTI